MNFEFLKNVKFENEYRDELIDHSIVAEWAARIDPCSSLGAARIALEALVSGIHKEKGEKPNVLFNMIDHCKKMGYFAQPEDTEALANDLRKLGNTGSHANPNESLRRVNEKNVRKAIDGIKYLFEIFKLYFGIDEEFDEDKIPFEDYCIIRKVKKAEGEIIVGDYNYFVREDDGDEYFLQCVPLSLDDSDSMAFVKRSEETRSMINATLPRRKYVCNITNKKLYGNHMRLVKYQVFKDCFLLSEYPGKKYNNLQILHIGLDIIMALLELKEVGDGVHHRNINPGCVVLSPSGKSYLAYLVNMQMAKIENSDGTILPQLAQKQRTNPYIPADVRRMPTAELANIPWEKVDVYSIAKTVLFCINPNAVAESYSTKKALAEMSNREFSDDFVDFFENILDGNTKNNPFLDEMKEVFENECENCDC